MSMLSSFENSYWEQHPQREVFRHRQAITWLKKINEPVADIGCGDGFFLKKMKELGLDSWGVDVSDSAVRACQEKGLHAEISDFGNGELPNKPIKTAVLLDVLEHLFEPEKILSTLHQREVEHLIISVPNFCSLPARMQVFMGGVPENNRPKKGHVYWFTDDVLRALLKKTGWQIETEVTNTFWMDKKILGYIMRRLSRVFPSLLGLSFLVLAKNVARDS